jgi:S1-C subfamily serine protease
MAIRRFDAHRRGSRGLARRARGVALGLGCGLALLGCSGLSGSAGSTPVVMWFDGYQGVFEGTAVSHGRFAPATLDLTSRIGDLRCVGTASTRIVPPEADPPHFCDGIHGDAHMTCSDGRDVDLAWVAEETCDKGYGEGQDIAGHTLRLIYGGSGQRARAIADDAVAGGARLPPLPALGAGEPGESSAREASEPSVSTGTAFFVTWDGHLVTNHHVVRGATRVQVQLSNGELVDAEVVRIDPDNDLALLRVEALRRPLNVEETSSLVRGAEVFTLGYPMIALQGQEQKATFGRVNSLTGMQGDARFSQIDVPIQPGNSGGPLIDTEGDVTGVVTSMLHPKIAYEMAGVVPQNVNYAVKSEYVHRLMQAEFPDGWKAERWEPRERDYSELVAEAESSVVLVLAW